MSFQRNAERFLEKFFQLAAWQPLLFLGLILAAQTVLLLNARELWFSDEVRHANVFEEMLRGNWLVLHMNGLAYPDKPPVYFWFLGLLRLIVGHARPSLFFLGAAVSGFFYLAALVILGRSVLKAEKATLFAAGGILLSSFYFIGVIHYSRMDLFFASLILLSQATFFQTLRQESPTRWAPAGFVLAAAATLTKGPLGLALPLATVVLYALWARKLPRLWRRDMGLGLLACLLILGAWAAGTLLQDGGGYLANIFEQQIYKRAVETWHHDQPFWHYFATLPLALLPWSLIPVAAGIPALASRNFWRELFRKRCDPEAQGSAYVWIMALGGLALLSIVSIKIIIYLLPLFAPLALLLARTLLGLSADRTRRLSLIIAGLLGLVAVGLPAGAMFAPWPVEVRGAWIAAVLLALLALGLWKLLEGKSSRSVLMYLLLGMTVWTQPVGLITAPSLDAGMSPKAQAEVMGKYIAEGYAPVAHRVYSGIYAYYARSGYTETHEMPELLEFLAQNPRVVAAMPAKYWDPWEDRQGLVEVHRQWIADREYVLGVRPMPEGQARQ